MIIQLVLNLVGT
uniref:Uncharacterized protein n=1 Tax=Arundo donax TaxID=35708 RepID=A0A0A9C3Y5_ARUDO